MSSSTCIACRFAALPGDKAFLGGVVVAKLFSDVKTSRALKRAFSRDLCERHTEDLRNLKDLKLLQLSEAIIEAYAGGAYAQGRPAEPSRSSRSSRSP